MLYNYKYQVSKEGFILQVFEPGTTIFVYNVSYPSYSECYFSGELIEDETPLSLGVMKSFDDIDGLTRFLVANKILQPGDCIKPGIPGMKPAPSVEEIATKHGSPVDHIREQLAMGLKVESEHSTDPTIQENIALQHLDENKDYYTKLDKMESTFAEGGITLSEVINRDYSELKQKLGEKKAKKYFEQVDRLINPNKNEVVEYRSNGVVTKDGNNYTFHALGDMELSNWRIAFTNDITDQFKKEPGEERDIYQYMNEMRKEYKMKEAWYSYIKDYIVKHDTNANVDEIMELAQKIADHDKHELALEHIVESIMYYNGRRTTNDPTFGRVTIWNVEGFLKYGKFHNDSLERLKEIGILPGKGSIDLLTAESLQKAWDEFFDNYDKTEDGAKHLLQRYFDVEMLPQADEKDGLGRDAMNDLTRLLIRAKVKNQTEKLPLIEAIASTIADTDELKHPKETIPVPAKKKNEQPPIPRTKEREAYKDLLKAFKDLYGIDAIQLWQKANEFYTNGIKDGEHTVSVNGFVSAVNYAFAFLGGGDKDVEKGEISADLVIALMTTDVLPEIKLKKFDLISPETGRTFAGLVNFLQIQKDIKPEKEILAVFKDVVSTDDLRPAMMGVYHDVNKQVLVGTNAHILCVLPQKITGQSRIIDLKTKKEIDAKYPDYSVVIPQYNPVQLKNVLLKSWLPKLNGMVKARKLCDNDNAVACCVHTEYSIQYFKPQLMLAIVSFFMKLGIHEVDLEIPSMQTRGMVLRASNMKGTMALIMPIYSENEVPSPLFDYLDLPGGATVKGQKEDAVTKHVETPKQDTSSIEEATGLMPEIIADRVAREAVDTHSQASQLSDDEKYRLVQLLVHELVNKTHQVYLHNDGFRKKLKGKGNAGRDHLYMFMQHWAVGQLQKWKIKAPASKPEEKVEPVKEQSAHEKYFGEAKETALTKQFVSIKAKYPDAVLLFKVGEYYEAFSTDAKIVSDVVGSTLTHAKGFNMTGFASNMIDDYLPKIVRAGNRVAIVEDGVEGKEKTMVKRSTPSPAPEQKEEQPENTERTERAIKQDKGIKALHPGKRTSADGNVYYEYRDNRSDEDRRKKFAEGGKLSKLKKYAPLLLKKGGTIDEINQNLASDEVGEIKSVIIPISELNSKDELDELLKEGWQYIEEAYPVPNKNNYFLYTEGDFSFATDNSKTTQEVWDLIDAPEKYSPKSFTSKYKIKDGILYRFSDHWGRVATCQWNAPIEFKKWQYNPNGSLTKMYLFKISLNNLKRRKKKALVLPDKKYKKGGKLNLLIKTINSLL